MKTAAQLVAEGYGGYAGWGDPAAWYDFLATGGAGKKTQPAGVQTPEQIAQATIDAAKKEIEAETKFLEGYRADNPFIFDEQLAKKSATQEYEPYYTELLDDYINTIGVSRDTVQSEEKLLKALSTASKGTAGQSTRAYDRAVAQAEEGFAGQGMFFSGIKKRSLGAGEVEREAEVGQMATDVLKKNRDISREQEGAIEGGVLQREREAITQYNVPFEQAYKRRFPTGTGTSLSGYTIPDYARF